MPYLPKPRFVVVLVEAVTEVIVVMVLQSPSLELREIISGIGKAEKVKNFYSIFKQQACFSNFKQQLSFLMKH